MKTVEELIINSLQELRKISWENEIKTQNSKLIFPKYCVGKHAKNPDNKRISEQEARFLFVRELEKEENTDFYYSVETPTKRPYKDFSTKKKNPAIGDEKNGNRSGSVDVTLHKKKNGVFNRKHLIEFKFDNVDTCRKDFLKLLCDDENCETNYYINIIKNDDKTTKERLENTLNDLEINKYKTAVEYVFGNCEKRNEKFKSDLKIFVCILNNIKITENNIIEYQIIDNKNQSIKEITKRIK